MTRAIALLALVGGLLAGCDTRSPEGPEVANAGAAIEAAAISQGLIAPAGAATPTGVFTRETDRVCIVPRGDRFAIGISIDYGDDIGCTARGTLVQAGAALRIELGDCAFDARLEVDEIVFPARVPTACARLCRGRASLSALRAQRLSRAEAEARSLRDARGKSLCTG